VARGCAIFIVEVTLRGIVASSYAGRERLADEAAPLDVLLVDAAADPLRRFTPDALTARFAVALARGPVTTARAARWPGRRTRADRHRHSGG